MKIQPMSVYRCKNDVTTLLDLGYSAPIADSEEMELLIPNTQDAAQEKHVPVLRFEEGKLLVSVGAQPHPMTPDHYIKWILVQTCDGGTFRLLTPEDAPEAWFDLKEDKTLNVYAYCNLHGLWKANVELLEFDQMVCSAEFPEGCIE